MNMLQVDLLCRLTEPVPSQGPRIWVKEYLINCVVTIELIEDNNLHGHNDLE